MRRTTLFTSCLLASILPVVGACSNYHDDTEYDKTYSNGQKTTTTETTTKTTTEETYPDTAEAAIEWFKQKDPSLKKFFDNAYGYAVFPKIGKGAIGIGAANGDGVVYEQGRKVGAAEMTQVTLGVQLGGQTYTELIFFQDMAHLDHFKAGHTEFAANASAVAVESGAAASNDYHEGLAVFTMPRGGLMFEASIGGQKFSYRPLK